MGEKTVQTTEGEVSYKTVVCDSCDDEIAKENAKEVLVGEIDSIQHLNSLGKHEYEFLDSRPDKYWLCDFCAGETDTYSQMSRDKTEAKEHSRLWHLAKVIKG